MNPGLLIVPFLGVLAVLTRSRRPFLLSLWTFSYFALPTVRNRFGPVSLYWSDLVALAVLVAYLPRTNEGKQRADLRGFYGLLLGTLSVGLVSAFVRYAVLFEPGFIVLRYALALAPLLVVPRIVNRPDLARAMLKGVTIAACLLAVVAVIQTTSRPLAIRLEALIYGDFSSNVGYRGGLIDEPGTLRAHGVFGSPTAFAGGAVIMGFVILQLTRSAKLRWWPVLPLAGCLLGLLLTYSRHGLLAVVVAAIAATVTNPHTALRRLGAVLVVLAVSSTVVSTHFWEERLSRGLTADVNLRTRLLDGPSDLAKRLQVDPVVGVVGIGLGVEHVVTSSTELATVREGFVSNSFLLYLLYAGICALVGVLVVFGLSIREALRLPPRDRSLALGALLAICVILASDNYGFFHMTMPFGWSLVVAMVHATTLGATEGRRPRPRSSDLAGGGGGGLRPVPTP